MSTKPNICLLFCGGTIGMILDPKTNALKPAESALELISNLPELAQIVNLDFVPVVNIDSSNMQPQHWAMLAEKIHEMYDKYDGFVVAHGTDTMAYTASALSFALENLGKPVAFTGSLIPFSEIGSDARNNLIHACMVASQDIGEVCVVLSNRILRANRAKKHHESLTAAFHSPNFPDLGELGRPIVLHEWRNRKHSEPITLKAQFNPLVSAIKLFPGLDPLIIQKGLERGVKGFIIEAFGSGNVPFLDNSIIPQIKNATDNNVPVLITTQMERGMANLNSYEAGLKAMEAGAISANDMTFEATLTKLMWCLGQNLPIAETKNLLSKNIAGELKEN